MMKTLPEREFVSLQNVLESYMNHMNKYPDSMITTFYGMHKIRWGHEGRFGRTQTSYLIIMGNLFSNWTVGNRFDLKGSS